MLIKPGNKLLALSEPAVIFGLADVDETFPKEAGIDDLGQLLSVLSLFDEPDIDFDDSYLTIKSGKNKVKYKYCDPSLIAYPKKPFNMPTTALQFVLTESDFKSLLKASSICSLPDMRLVGKGKTGRIQLHDAKDEGSNTFDLDVEVNCAESAVYNIVFLVSNLKFISDDYDVVVGETKAVKFISRNHPVEYVVAMEATSTIE